MGYILYPHCERLELIADICIYYDLQCRVFQKQSQKVLARQACTSVDRINENRTHNRCVTVTERGTTASLKYCLNKCSEIIFVIKNLYIELLCGRLCSHVGYEIFTSIPERTETTS